MCVEGRGAIRACVCVHERVVYQADVVQQLPAIDTPNQHRPRAHLNSLRSLPLSHLSTGVTGPVETVCAACLLADSGIWTLGKTRPLGDRSAILKKLQ